MAASKCDEVLAALVVKRIAAGAPIPVACAAEGVSRQNLEQWRRRAETGDAATLHFLAEVERAHARFISQRVVNIAAAGFAAAGAATGLGAGGGQVMLPSLMTVRPRMASSSMLTLMMPSLVLHSSSVRRNRLVAYSVEDCLAKRLFRSV